MQNYRVQSYYWSPVGYHEHERHRWGKKKETCFSNDYLYLFRTSTFRCLLFRVVSCCFAGGLVLCSCVDCCMFIFRSLSLHLYLDIYIYIIYIYIYISIQVVQGAIQRWNIRNNMSWNIKNITKTLTTDESMDFRKNWISEPVRRFVNLCPF